MKTIAIYLLLFLNSLLVSAQYVTINVSVKIILDANGDRPLFNPLCSGAVCREITNGDIESIFENINIESEPFSRGMRFNNTEIVEIGDDGNELGINPSDWFLVDFVGENKRNFERLVSSQEIFQWRTNAINVYINQGEPGGICSTQSDEEIIIVGSRRLVDFETFLHEIGHYFNLFHTHGRTCDDCDPINSSGECHTTPQSDEIDDTIGDLRCWSTRNDIANGNFMTSYASLSNTQQRMVDDVFNNVMSYYPTRKRFTEDQLDKMSQRMNTTRRQVINGQYHFVHNSNDAFEEIDSNKYRTILDAVENSNPNDIIMIERGNYNEGLRITKPVTLRATREGIVEITKE